MTTTTAHRVRWFGVIPGTGEHVPRTHRMAGGDWGWEAVCSCGWATRTGGGIQERIREEIADHRAEAEAERRAHNLAVAREYGERGRLVGPAGADYRDVRDVAAEELDALRAANEEGPVAE